MNKSILYIFNSKENNIGLVFFKIIIVGIVALILLNFIVMPQFLYGYNASIIDKVNRLSSISEPKIVLIGDSNLTFGIRSELIEEEMGMPVVNLGIHGGLGNRFHENLIRGNIREGDIIIICHSSYSHVADKLDPVLTWVTVENHYDLWKYIPMDEWVNMLKAYPTYLKKCINNMEAEISNIQEEECYSRLSFNEQGDNIYNETHDEQFEFEEDYFSNASFVDDEVVYRINQLNKYAVEKGAKLYIAGYPIAVDSKINNEQIEEFTEFQNELEQKMDAKVISNFTDYFLNYKYFFNTQLHLTADGAMLRTQQLIKDLKNGAD